MIPNVVLHIENEQPLLADLYRLPEPTDVGLLCTNVRMLNGNRPVFIDHVGSVFFFPYRVIRFLEIAPSAAGELAGEEPVEHGEIEPVPDADLELDEDLLRRVREA